MISIKICIKFFNEENIHVFNSHNKDQFEGGIKINVAVASFVSVKTRFQLYKLLEKLDRRVLYCDTYSIILYFKTRRI